MGAPYTLKTIKGVVLRKTLTPQDWFLHGFLDGKRRQFLKIPLKP
jgi:hypothetical protein